MFCCCQKFLSKSQPNSGTKTITNLYFGQVSTRNFWRQQNTIFQKVQKLQTSFALWLKSSDVKVFLLRDLENLFRYFLVLSRQNSSKSGIFATLTKIRLLTVEQISMNKNLGWTSDVYLSVYKSDFVFAEHRSPKHRLAKIGLFGQKKGQEWTGALNTVFAPHAKV